MLGQFDATAELRGGGKTLHVHGPVTDWEDDERGAVMHVTVTQGQSKVTGQSGFTPANAVAWSATLTGDDVFNANDADGVMVAIVHLTDGNTEPYPYPGGALCQGQFALRPV